MNEHALRDYPSAHESGICHWCRRWVEYDPTEHGKPDWHEDGDYGCDRSPWNSEEGTGGHLVLLDPS